MNSLLKALIFILNKIKLNFDNYLQNFSYEDQPKHDNTCPKIGTEIDPTTKGMEDKCPAQTFVKP